jgi:hypothetical protein
MLNLTVQMLTRREIKAVDPDATVARSSGEQAVPQVPKPILFILVAALIAAAASGLAAMAQVSQARAVAVELVYLEQQYRSLLHKHLALQEEVDSHLELSDLRELRLIAMELNNAVSYGVITDELWVERAWLWIEDGDGRNRLFGRIEVRPQPDIATRYLGEGRFNLPEQELRKYLAALIEELEERAELEEHAPDLEVEEIEIRIYNYPVGIYNRDGAIVLTRR